MRTKERLTRGSLLKQHGAWHIRYYEGGKQRSVKICDVCDEFRTKGDVIPEANKLLARIAPAVQQPNSSRTHITEFVDQVYLPWVRAERSPATTNGYEKMWNKHLEKHFGAMELGEYQPHHATEFLSHLARKGLGRYAVSHVRALMSGIFAHAVARGYLRVNPIHDARLLVAPKPPKPTPHYTIEEMRAILNLFGDDPLAQVVMALSFLGLRPSEARGLQWDDVDFTNAVIMVRRSMWRKHVSEGGKGARSVRNVSFGPVIAGILEKYQKSLPQPVVTTYLLETGTRGSLDVWNFAAKSIRPRLAEAGILWKSFYAGRRGSETELMRYTNGNTQLTAPQFGHSQRVAEAHYVKPLPDETRKAVLALDAAFELQQDTDDSGSR